MDRNQFQRDEVLRTELARGLTGYLGEALRIFESEQEEGISISSPTDLAKDALLHAERVGYVKFKQFLNSMAFLEAPRKPDVIEPDYSGKTPFDQIAEDPQP